MNTRRASVAQRVRRHVMSAHYAGFRPLKAVFRLTRPKTRGQHIDKKASLCIPDSSEGTLAMCSEGCGFKFPLLFSSF